MKKKTNVVQFKKNFWQRLKDFIKNEQKLANNYLKKYTEEK